MGNRIGSYGTMHRMHNLDILLLSNCIFFKRKDVSRFGKCTKRLEGTFTKFAN